VSWVPAERVIQAVQFQRQVIAEQEKRLADANAYHHVERQKIDGERGAAAQDLGKALLPRLDAASIAAAAEATGMVGLPAENIIGQLEARRAWLAGRLQQILNTPDYAQRELLRHPRTGSLTRALAEATEYRGLAYQFVGACEANPRFERLIETGWGTAEEKAPWWRYSYWQDRSAAADVVAKSGKASFAEVRDQYLKGKQDVATYDADIHKIRTQISAGEALQREYGVLWDEHHTLDARGLEHTRGRLVQHLLGVDAATVTQRLRAASSPFLMLFLRASGLQAKASYLDAIHTNNANDLGRELYAQKQKLDDVEMKTRRRWAPMPADRYQKLIDDRRPRYEKRWQRWGKTYQTVYVYDRWDRARYYDDLLWWDLMTRGRYDGSYIPEVNTYHQTHPDYQFEPDWKSLAANYQYDDYRPGDADGGGAAETGADTDDATAAAESARADMESVGPDDGGGATETGADGDLVSTDGS
jgi:hypothetical protein